MISRGIPPSACSGSRLNCRGLLDMVGVCSKPEGKRPTAHHVIELQDDTHQMFRLAPHCYRNNVLRSHVRQPAPQGSPWPP
jgi:hypothetical protein